MLWVGCTPCTLRAINRLKNKPGLFNHPCTGGSMAALTQSQLDQLAKRLNEDNQALLREVRDELENSGDQPRIDLLSSEPGEPGDESMANARRDFTVAIVD